MRKILFKLLAGPIGRIIGHRNLVRYGEFVARAGRLDFPNDPNENGEALVQSIVLGETKDDPVVVVDCGANVGNWTLELCNRHDSSSGDQRLAVFCFEPSNFTYNQLCTTINKISAEGVVLTPVNMALSSINGESSLSIVHAGAGTNSLIPIPGIGVETEETVSLTTLDSFMEQRNVSKITFLKIDTEGHDAAVLEGAKRLIAQNRVSIIQFEYNWRWIYGNYLLHGVYEELSKSGYHIGKITPRGIQFYPRYDAALETFEEANYLACTSSWRAKFPEVDSWKRR